MAGADCSLQACKLCAIQCCELNPRCTWPQPSTQGIIPPVFSPDAVTCPLQPNLLHRQQICELHAINYQLCFTGSVRSVS